MLTGIDVLRANGFAELKGLNVGLVTNHTGRARDGATTIDLLAAAPGMKLVALFSPGARHPRHPRLVGAFVGRREDRPHDSFALRGHPAADARDADRHRRDGDRSAGHRRALLHLHDDDGLRHGGGGETEDRVSSSSTGQIRSAASRSKGPALDETALGFTGYMTQMPIRPALTLGELAKLFNDERKIGANLTVDRDAQLGARRVVRRNRAAVDQPVAEHAHDERGDAVSGHRRASRARTCRSAAAPTRRSSTSARRGSTAPILAETLNARQIPGVRFYPVTFTPASSKFAKEECHGVFILITDRDAVRPVRVGVEIASALLQALPGPAADRSRPRRLFGSTDGLRQAQGRRGSGRRLPPPGRPPKPGGGC